MALFGEATAVVPVGISCQVAHQIGLASDMLGDMLGEKLAHHATPFDWRIVGPADVAGMLRENNPYPQSGDELSGDRRRYWAKRRCWFWHDKWDDFARFTEKQAHLWANWGRIGATKRQIFIASNAQNNLKAQSKDPGGFTVQVKSADLFALHAVLATLFPAPELHFVTRAPLMDRLDAFGVRGESDGRGHVMLKSHGASGVTIHTIPKDPSQWQGDARTWRPILARIARLPSAARRSMIAS